VRKELRSGYTTGACAAAAAKGAAQMLLTQTSVSEVSIDLPAGVSATFQLHGQEFSASSASCFVVKDAGDDPDVTNGAEVWATAGAWDKGHGARVVIEGGIGIGKVTKPGLAVPTGEWAINPVPRRMIEEEVLSVFSSLPLAPCPLPLKVIISIPDGEERARKTLNARLGIIGGLSILGTTGIVRPISAKAWTDTIDASLDVAKACGCPAVVLSTGRSSEMAVQEFFRVKGQGSRTDYSNLPLAPSQLGSLILKEEAYIMMGDHVAYALRACAARGFIEPIIACQFAKLLKIACGYENTHAAASELDLSVLRGWAETAQVPPEHLAIISRANTAREIAVATGFDTVLMGIVAARARQAAAVHAPGIQAQPLLCGYNGTVVL